MPQDINEDSGPSQPAVFINLAHQLDSKIRFRNGFPRRKQRLDRLIDDSDKIGRDWVEEEFLAITTSAIIVYIYKWIPYSQLECTGISAIIWQSTQTGALITGGIWQTERQPFYFLTAKIRRHSLSSFLHPAISDLVVK